MTMTRRLKNLFFANECGFILLSALTAFAVTPTVEIKVDQTGYLPASPKVAFVVTAKPAGTFAVKRAADGIVVYQGKLSVGVDDADSGDRVQSADFSQLKKTGQYFLEVEGVGRSWEFAVRQDVYSRAYYLAMRSFYGQRCGTAVDLGAEFPGYSYAACHPKGAWHVTSGKDGVRLSIKGWHDAGDYGRYIVNSGITTGTLLWTWELFGKEIGKIKLNLPESGNGTPDILNEIRWNLEWMLSMQDEDGGVWHKQTSERFPGFIMPDKDTTVSYVIGTGQQPYKGTAATADYATVMAIAARVYKPFDLPFATLCLKAAQQAWQWASAHPNLLFRNPPGISTGGYVDPDCSDELLWASAELWRTTGEEQYHLYFLDHYRDHLKSVWTNQPEGWAHVAPFALWTYALGHGKNVEALTAIRKESLAAADQIVERSSRNGYRISMRANEYEWGSNGVVANYGLQLLVANRLQPRSSYVQTTLDNLHYLLGRNAFSLSWVTRVGQNPFRHPHHRPSSADNNPEPWPGLLSGGPNYRRQDEITRKLPQLPPAKIYVDSEASYASNENAINWNASLVFLLAGVMAEK
jgi:endoglucanase